MSIRQLLCVAVCVLVGVAARINGGNYHPAAIGLIAVAIVIGIVIVADPFGVASRRVAGRWLTVALLAALVVNGVALIAGPLVSAGHFSLDSDLTTAAADAAGRDTARTIAGVGLCGVVIGAMLCAAAMILGATGRRYSADLCPDGADSRRKNAARAQVSGVPPTCGTRMRRLGMLGVAILLASHLVSGLATVRIAVPPMDVIVFQDLAARELLDGGLPYSMTFPDLSGGTSPHYGEGLQANGQLLFGFPYPPLSLLAVLPAPLIGGSYGDFRFIHALCITGVGALIVVGCHGLRYAAARGSRSDGNRHGQASTPAHGTQHERAPTDRTSADASTRGLVAAMFLLTPIAPQVIVNGWTEPLVAVLLAAVVAVAARQPRWAGIPLGLLWSAKQYVPLTAPLMWLLPVRWDAPRTGSTTPVSERTREDPDSARELGGAESGSSRVRSDTGVARWKTLLIALIAGAIVTLPLALMDIAGVWRSVVTLQLSQPFRPDALSLLSLLHRVTGDIPPSWPAFVALAAAQAIALWRMPRTPAAFAAATAVALLVFFALSKQAFANYYYLVVAAAALGACDRSEPKEPSHARD